MPSTSETQTTSGTFAVSSSGRVRSAHLAYARDKIGKVLADVGRPVLHTSIRLELSGDPSLERPAEARATIDIDGQAVRTHVRAAEMTEAVDLLEARMRRRLEQLAEHRRALRRRGPTSPPGEWRHGDPATSRLPYHPRPPEEREIVRRKSFSTVQSSVDEAIFDLESMDHDFFLFTDVATGTDALVHRLEGGTYGLQYSDGPGARPSDPTAAAVEVDPEPAPRLAVGEARERLDLGGAPFVFFVDRDDGRGHVLYRRVDGHYGLIAPAG